MSNLEAAAVQHVHHTVAFDNTLGLAIDFYNRTIAVDETIGVHIKLQQLQSSVDNLHHLFVELHEKLRPLLLITDERNAVLDELQKDIDVLRARKEKLAEEVSELNLLL